MKKATNFLVFLFTLLFFSGCATMEMQKQAKFTKPIFIDKSKYKNSTIYIQVNNIEKSGGENINLKQRLHNALNKKGYIIVNSSKNSDINLYVDVLFVNNIKEALALKSALGYGTMSGINKLSTSRSGSDALGVGLVMALGAGLAGKALEDETYRGVFSIKLKEAQKEQTSKVFTEVIQVNLNKEEALSALAELSSMKT